MHALETIYGAANPGGLSLHQISVLNAIKLHGPHTSGELQGLTGMGKTVIFSHTKRLKRDGYLTGTPRPQAKQGTDPLVLDLTQKARRALNAAEGPLWNAEVTLMARLTPGERASFLNALAVTAYSGPKNA